MDNINCILYIVNMESRDFVRAYISNQKINVSFSKQGEDNIKYEKMFWKGSKLD